MKRGFWLVLVLALGHLAWAAGDEVPRSDEKNKPVGYVDCSNRDKGELTPTYLGACGRSRNIRLACGQSVTVIEKQGPWLKVGLPVGGPRYVLATMVSRRVDRFVPFDADSGIADLGPPSCPAPPEDEGSVRGPRVIFAPDPEYSDKARKKKTNGTVVLSVTVGTDGLPHDIKVEKKVGQGLDEKALEAMRKWRFQPAVKDGQPIETHIYVEMSFRLY